MGKQIIRKPVVLIFLALFLTLIVFRILSTPDRILSWDVFGYYLYLPAKFIHNDLPLQNQAWLTELINQYEPTATLYQAVKLDNGNWVMKYSIGMAIVYFPFFLIAHALAYIFNFPADGLSDIYQYTLAIGGILIAFAGLIYFFKVLQHYFPTRTSILILLVFVFGTNYFQLITFEGTLLTHNFLFTLYALLLFFTMQWHQKQRIKYALGIGIVCGLCTIIRPSEVICILIPLFWNIFNKKSLINKLNLIRSNYLHLIIIAFSFTLILLPQIIYWKMITGEYFFYSYTNPGEGFDFLSPHTIDFLFSFRKGWLIYTPIMIFSFIGFYFLYKKNKSVFISILLFLIIDIYIISSWSCWWYAGASFSSRSIVPAYVFLALPFGYLLEYFNKTNRIIKTIGYVVIIFFVTLNLFQTWQFENSIITRDTMTKEYYCAIFGKTKVDDDAKKLLLVNRFADPNEIFIPENDYIEKTLYKNGFENTIDSSSNFKDCFLMNSAIPYSPGVDMKYKDLTSCDHAWIQISADIFIPEGYNEESPLLVIHFTHNEKAYKYFTKEISKKDIQYNNWNHVKMDYLTPEVRTIEDNFKAYLWHRGSQNVYIDNLLIKSFEPRKQLDKIN